MRGNGGIFEPFGGLGAVFGDIAFDPEGNMYLQGIRSPYAVIKLSPEGDVLAYWGPPGTNNGQFQTTDQGIGISSFTNVTTGKTWVYVLDSGNCRVQRFGQDGSFLGSFGACGVGSNLFTDWRNIMGLEVSPITGDVYVVDCVCGTLPSGRMLQFDSLGNFKTSWNTPDGKAHRSVTVDPDTGDVWTITWYGGVSHFTPDGTLIATITEDSTRCPDGALTNPRTGGERQDLAVKSGTVYIATDRRIEKFDPMGSCILDWGDTHGALAGEADLGFSNPFGPALAGIVIQPDGHVWAATGRYVREWTGSGGYVRAIIKPDAPGEHMVVAVAEDTIYFTNHFEILRYDLAGHMKGFWTWDGHNSGAKCASFTQITVHPSSGEVYVPCVAGLVRQYSPSGIVLRQYGTLCNPCTGALGEIPSPMGIAVDSSGNVYVSSQHPLGNRVTKFDSTGTPIRVWGTTGFGPGQFFFAPQTGEMTIGSDGNLYVVDAADSGGVPKRVQVFTPDGALLRVWPLLSDPQGPSNTLTISSLAFREDPALGPLAYVSAPWSPDSVRFGFRIYKVRLDGTMLGIALSNLDGFGSAYGQDIQIGKDGDLYSGEAGSQGGTRLSRWKPANNPPTASTGGPYTVGEGASIVLAGTGSDPDQDPLTYKWDLDNDGTFETRGQNPTFSATGLDGPSTKTIVLQVCDPSGACATDTTTASVLNLSPSITSVTNDGPVNEGTAASITVTATDPAGTFDPLIYEFDCDNDGVYEIGPQSGNSASCFFADNGTFTVWVRVTDDEGATATGSTQVVVNNLPPSADAGSQYFVLEGDSIVLSGSGSDVPGDMLTFSWDLNDDGVFEAVGQAVTFSATDGPLDHTVVLRVCDEDGGCTEASTLVSIGNTAPAVTLAGDSLVNEGSAATYTFTVSDPGADTYSVSLVDCGTNGNLVEGSLTFGPAGGTFQCFFSDGLSSSVVTVQVADSDGANSNVAESNVTVNNVSPETEAGGPYEGVEGTPVLFAFSCSDPGTDTWAATVNWGDGTIENLGSASCNLGTFSSSHTYTAIGTYTLTVTVADDDNGSGSDQASIVVLNTPEGSNVVVTIGNIRLTFTTVTSAGVTSLQTSSRGPPPPTGFKIIGTRGAPIYYDISTTASFSGPITVCITYDDSDVTRRESSLRLKKNDGTGWIDVTTSVDTSLNVICGVTDSLSIWAVVEDIEAPSLSLPDNILAEAEGPAGAVVDYVASAADNSDGTLSPFCSPASGSMFPIGVTLVTCSVTDSAGNTATGSFQVKVQDTTSPELVIPSDITVEATGSAGAVVGYSVSATDIVDGSVTPVCSPASAANFVLRTTLVSCTATDAAGNSATRSFNVIVQDTTPPDLSLPQNMIVEATGPSGAQVFYVGSASDIVDGQISPLCSPASGSAFPIGTTGVNCQATDSHGNSASASFTVTVVDTTPPALTLPDSIVAVAPSPAGAIVTYTATASDLVSGDIPVTCSPSSGSLFPIGTTTVHCTATDSAGNTAASSFTLTVFPETGITFPESDVTTGELCGFDQSADPGQQFKLIFTPDPQSTGLWKLSASNPGQFFYNVFYVGPAGPVALTITIPYPFVTQGTVPVHAYDATTISNGCFVRAGEVYASSQAITLNSYPGTFGTTTQIVVTLEGQGFVHLTVHLDYGLKGALGYSKDSSNNAVSATGPTILNLGNYVFSVSGSVEDSKTLQNVNAFKHDPGFGGLVQDAIGNPVANVKVQIFDSNGKLLATVYTDQDGWYQYTYKLTGKSQTFTVKLPDYSLQQSVVLRANSFVVANFAIKSS